MGVKGVEHVSSVGDGEGCPVRSSMTDLGTGTPASSTDSTTSDKHLPETATRSSGVWSSILSWVSLRANGGVQSKEQDANGSSAVGCPVKRSDAGQAPERSGESADQASGCPVKHGSDVQSPDFNVRNNEFIYGQEKLPGQSYPLSTSRQRSSIPKAEYNPSHQPEVSILVL